jgi:hypothetical protein
MKNFVTSVAKLSAYTLLLLCSFATNAESPFAKPQVERFRIDFLVIPQWVEITNINETPERINIKLVNEARSTIEVADFVQDGEASPELVSVFKNRVYSRLTLFVIVKWHYYLSGLDTEGDYYEVHAYEIPEGGNEIAKLVENKSVSALFGSGFEGKKEGKFLHFRFKDATSIRKALSHIGH